MRLYHWLLLVLVLAVSIAAKEEDDDEYDNEKKENDNSNILLLDYNGYEDYVNNDSGLDDEWSQCQCRQEGPSASGSARMAYLISVHNKRTIHDGAHLLKSLMETSSPGDIAVILIHVDARVGIAERTNELEEEQDDSSELLYFDSPLRRFVEACQRSRCARSANNSKTTAADSDTDLSTHSRSNQTVIEVMSRFSPEWSKWSMNDPTLHAMDVLVHMPRYRRQWDVFVNLSGDTRPVLTASSISALFGGPLHNLNFVTSSSCVTGLLPTSIRDFPYHWMKRAHYRQHHIPNITYIDDDGQTLTKDIEVYFGSQWMALTHEFVDYVVRSRNHPNGLANALQRALEQSAVLMTDETYFATLLMNSRFRSTAPPLDQNGKLATWPMYAIRYERMDENAPNAWNLLPNTPLYDIPPKFADITNNESGSKPWGPYFLGLYDLGAIKRSKALFVRKVSYAVDENLIRLLPVESHDELMDVYWPKLGVTIKNPVRWELEKKRKLNQNNNTKKESSSSGDDP